MLNGHFTIQKKQFINFIGWLLMFLAIGVPTFALIGQKYDVRIVGPAFNQRFDLAYDIRHRTCSTTVAKLETVEAEHAADIKEIKAMAKFLVLLQSQKMSWEDKEHIVNDLVEHDSLSYGVAYDLINHPFKEEGFKGKKIWPQHR